MRYCIDCGMEFPEGTAGNKMRCAACQREWKNEQARARERRLREERKSTEYVRKSHDKTKRNMTLGELAAEARAAGMSYGQYVARMKQ